MHEHFMLAALEQAYHGRGLCAPNPSVGAVAVQQNKIIAQAWHRGAGTPHAERLLLAELPDNCQDITLYVTLEPCNHWGKTPPCVDAIIEHGIKRVVYAYADPNPVVANNNTPMILREKGIDVLHYPMSVVDAFYQSYQHWILTKRPWVTAKIAQTFDGKIAGKGGERLQLSNALCANFTHNQRMKSDIILTTSRTINLDNPLFTVRLPDIICSKPLAILDSELTLNPQAKALSLATHCHVYHDKKLSSTQQFSVKNCTLHGVTSVNGYLDLQTILDDLGRRGYHDVWVEAGGELFSALHQAQLVNRTHIYLVPRLLGESGIVAYHDQTMFARQHTVQWQVMNDNIIATLDW